MWTLRWNSSKWHSHSSRKPNFCHVFNKTGSKWIHRKPFKLCFDLLLSKIDSLRIRTVTLYSIHAYCTVYLSRETKPCGQLIIFSFYEMRRSSLEMRRSSRERVVTYIWQVLYVWVHSQSCQTHSWMWL